MAMLVHMKTALRYGYSSLSVGKSGRFGASSSRYAPQAHHRSPFETQTRFLGRVPPPRLHQILFGGFQKILKSEVDPGEVKGTKLRILKYPHPQLRAMNAEVSTFDDSLMQTAKEMLMVMYAADGIGLAAPQVGINKRLMVFNEAGEPEKKEQEMILVNPVITARSVETNLREEGCLSFPQINGDVQRYEWVEIEYQTTSGQKTKT